MFEPRRSWQNIHSDRISAERIISATVTVLSFLFLKAGGGEQRETIDSKVDTT